MYKRDGGHGDKLHGDLFGGYPAGIWRITVIRLHSQPSHRTFLISDGADRDGCSRFMGDAAVVRIQRRAEQQLILTVLLQSIILSLEVIGISPSLSLLLSQSPSLFFPLYLYLYHLS